ncbi:MAG TPA: hypothetical protein PLJ27_26885, partial [Polyangiaceae bacterium]|nr:hypothetical protein [Polyangiaceae bacterium]
GQPPLAPTSDQPLPKSVGLKVLGMWIGGAAVIGLLVSAIGAWWFLPKPQTHHHPIASATVASPTRTRSTPSGPASTESETTPSALSLPSLAERAAQGDPDAIDQIERRPAPNRTFNESLAWARGKSVFKHRQLELIAKELRADLPLSADRRTLAKLKPFTEDPETATEALAILASLRTPLAVDMLYDVWVRRRDGTIAFELAKSLLYTPEIREAASDALAVVLDLRAASTCEQVAELLPRVQQRADRRALPMLGKLTSRYGCGRLGGHDCYPCLRGSNAVNDAIAAVGNRPAPDI